MLCVIYVSSISAIQGIFKMSHREKEKKSEETFVFELVADIERSIKVSPRCGNANPRAPRVIRGRKISPEKRNPPRSPVNSPGRRRGREHPPRRHPQKAARSRGCAILKSVPLVARLTPSTRPAREVERAHGARKRGRERESI